MKFYVVEVYEELLSHLNFHFDRAVLLTLPPPMVSPPYHGGGIRVLLTP
jgi:hypothetical protein